MIYGANSTTSSSGTNLIPTLIWGSDLFYEKKFKIFAFVDLIPNFLSVEFNETGPISTHPIPI